MLLKWIICQVPDHLKEEFSALQPQWKRLLQVSGFLGHMGGWNITSSNQACILGVWRDQQSYESFMKHEHDIFDREIGQAGSYTEIKTAVFEQTMQFKDSISAVDMSKVGILRVADCHVKKERVEAFLAAERDIWIPGVSKTSGICTGTVARSLSDECHYLAATFWQDAESHAKYAFDVFPGLTQAAKSSENVATIDSFVIKLEPSWFLQAGQVSSHI